ncbi:MAG: hypothetical protein ACE5MH_03575 [Terriglobia bacterium]
MKDPWQTEETAYEVLGLDEQAGEEEVERAFKLALARGRNAQQLLAARNTLRRPLARAFLNLFRYDLRALAPLVRFSFQPDGLAQAGGRQQLAQVLLRVQRKSFPHPAASHALAVLYYWSARQAGTQAAAAAVSAPLSPWGAAIAHLVLLGHLSEFWEGWRGAHPGVEPEALRERLATYLQGELRTRAEGFRRAGQGEKQAEFENYLLQYALEERVARSLGEMKETFVVNGQSLWLPCGPLLLEFMGWLDPVREQVVACSQHQPSTVWRELAAALSPLGRVQALLENRQVDAALDSLNHLPVQQLKSPEAAHLRARLYLAKGHQHASLGELREAMAAWRQVRKTNPDDDVLAELSTAVTAAVRERARALLETQPEEAGKLLKQALGVADSDELQSLQGEILTRRAFRRVDQVLEQRRREGISEGELEGLRRELEQTVHELQQAAPWSAGAQDYLPTARDLLADWPNVFDPDWCWFCGQRPADPERVHKHDMNRETERSGGYVRYQTLALETPRCSVCAGRHKLATVLGGIAGIGVAILVLIAGIAGGSFFGGLIAGVIGGLILFVVTKWLVELILVRPRGTRREGYHKKSPPYRRAQEEGFHDGSKPSDVE